MTDHLAGSKASILAYVEELKDDRKSACAALDALLSGDESMATSQPADTASTVAAYEQTIANLDETISRYEADLTAGRFVD